MYVVNVGFTLHLSASHEILSENKILLLSKEVTRTVLPTFRTSGTKKLFCVNEVVMQLILLLSLPVVLKKINQLQQRQKTETEQFELITY